MISQSVNGTHPSQAEAGPPIVLSAEGLSKRYGATEALVAVDLNLRRGEVHALLGSNGSGKSTLVKLLCGIERADAGVLNVNGQTIDARTIGPVAADRFGVRVVHQQEAVFPGLTVAENLAAGHGFPASRGVRIRWRALEHHTQRVLDRFEIDVRPQDRVDDLSPSRRRMLLIARALQNDDVLEGGVLILDEPTAALPRHEVQLLLGALRSYAKSGLVVLFVTHRLDEVVGLAERATVLTDGHVTALPCGDELTTERLVELVCGRTTSELGAAHGAARPRGESLLKVKDLAGGSVVSATFEVFAGEIVGVAGITGSGRTSLLQMIFGLHSPTTGEITIDGGHQARGHRHPSIGYVPEDRQRDATFAGLTLRENLTAASVHDFRRRGRLNHHLERSAALELIARFDIRASSDQQPFTSLSGGNQQKAVLARWIRKQPRLLLLDEPSAAVDVGARADLHSFIRETADSGAAALVVSSDFEELTQLCDRVIVLRRGRTVAELTTSGLSPIRLEHLANRDQDVPHADR
jgi:ribose transport system ATP-binding protein